jgi:hypothetical protein
VLADAGVQVAMSDLFSPGGQKLLAETRLPGPSRARVDSQLRLISALDFEIELFAKLVADRLRTHPGYPAIRVIPRGDGRSTRPMLDFFALRCSCRMEDVGRFGSLAGAAGFVHVRDPHGGSLDGGRQRGCGRRGRQLARPRR